MIDPITNGENGVRNALGQFVEGNPGGPGRPKSSRHRLSEAFFKALADDCEQNGPEAVRILRETNPEAYGRLIGSLQSKESSVDVTHRHKEMPSDEDVIAMAEAVIETARIRSERSSA